MKVLVVFSQNKTMKYLHIYFAKVLAIFKSNLTILFSVIITYLAPIQPLLFAVGLMIFLDTISGVIRSIKLQQTITSRKLSQIITKMLLYQGAIISLFLVEKLLLHEFIGLFTSITYFLTKIGAVTLVFIEAKSINENVTQATGVDVWETFKLMLSRAKYIKDEMTALAATENKKEDKA